MVVASLQDIIKTNLKYNAVIFSDALLSFYEIHGRYMTLIVAEIVFA
jgi:hypothetical protein